MTVRLFPVVLKVYPSSFLSWFKRFSKSYVKLFMIGFVDIEAYHLKFLVFFHLLLPHSYQGNFLYVSVKIVKNAVNGLVYMFTKFQFI